MKKHFFDFLKHSMWVAIVMFAIRCLISLKTLISDFSAYDVFGYAGEAIAFTVLLMVVYERWLWRYIRIGGVPVLKKVYTGTIKSSYDGKERKATIKIKQTLLSVQVSLFTAESHSQSISASLTSIFDEWQLIYTYLNNPKMEVEERSRMHYGAVILNLESVDCLKGLYFTSRGHRGDMQFSAQCEEAES